MQKRGQISIEFVIIIGFALMMLIPLALIFYEHSTTTYTEVNYNQAGLIARKIVDNANEVYFLGYPTSVTLKVFMPEQLDDIKLINQEIIMVADGQVVAVAAADINLSGNITSASGLRLIKISANRQFVNISDGN